MLRRPVIAMLALSLLLASTLVVLCERSFGASAPAPYTFGVLPFLIPEHLEAGFAPIAAAMECALGRAVRLRSATSFTAFTTALEAGSTTWRLSDRKGATIALPPATTAVSMAARQALREAGLDVDRGVTLSYLPEETACIRHVLARLAHACASSRLALHVLALREGVDYRLLAEVPASPPALYAVHPRVPAAERLRLTQTLLALPAPHGVPAATGWHQFMSLVPATASEYDALRATRAALEGE